jgi:hypothetical protein
MDEKLELEIELMKAQIDHTRLDMEKLRQDLRWEPWKAFATILGGILVGLAAMLGAVLGLATWLAPHLK